MKNKNYPNFLELDITPASFENALFHILPAPLEKSVSYGSGTAKGPQAILQASLQLEAFDGQDIPAESGIHTHPPVKCGVENVQEDLATISAEVSKIIDHLGVPIILGGEHTVTLGALKAFAERNERIGVVQFDAHCDLRDTYENNPLSHACVMRRVHELGFPIMQIGIRSLSQPEDVFSRENSIPCLDAKTIYREGIPEEVLPPGFPEKIYITFDVDCLDPSIMPATGTPEPGGLGWYQAIDLLGKVAAGRNICGFDVVELAPSDGLHAADFTAAKLVYTLIGIISRSKSV
ncbi:agmatinase [Thermodesulfobacteriota bacterium]